jgi:hypothetical protein
MLEPVLDHSHDRLLRLHPLGIEGHLPSSWRADAAPALHQCFLLPEAPLPVQRVEAGAVLGRLNTGKAQRAAKLGEDRWREEFRLLPLVQAPAPDPADSRRERVALSRRQCSIEVPWGA